MDAKGIWRGFTETGDPVCYLLAKRLERPPRPSEEKNDTDKAPRSGDLPRSTD